MDSLFLHIGLLHMSPFLYTVLCLLLRLVIYRFDPAIIDVMQTLLERLSAIPCIGKPLGSYNSTGECVACWYSNWVRFRVTILTDTLVMVNAYRLYNSAIRFYDACHCSVVVDRFR